MSSHRFVSYAKSRLFNPPKLTALGIYYVCVFGCVVSRGQEIQVAMKPTVQAMQNAIEQKEIAGAVTIVADKDQLIDFHATGLANIAQKNEMKKDSIFWIASMSKPITGACVMMMVDEGKITLDDPIEKHLPAMSALRTEDGEKCSVTIGQLMNHTSGMREIPAPNTYASATLEEAVKKYAELPLASKPGSKWQYSQTSINTAARIVEVVSGMSFDKFVEERLCKPLGMTDTVFYLTDEQNVRLATSYKRTDAGQLEPNPIALLNGASPTDRNRMPAANGGLFSTAGDYAKFCQMLLNDGTVAGKKILSSDAAQTFRTINTGELVTAFTPGNGWGVGCCVVREPQGVTDTLSPGTFGHGGAFGTQAWIDPVKNRVYIMMVQRSNFQNGDNSNVRKAFQAAAVGLK
jgi:CubicO group peptidase (beta-lactamase class C family)